MVKHQLTVPPMVLQMTLRLEYGQSIIEVPESMSAAQSSLHNRLC